MTPVSQDKLSPGETVAATEFPRIFCRFNFAERPYQHICVCCVSIDNQRKNYTA